MNKISIGNKISILDSLQYLIMFPLLGRKTIDEIHGNGFPWSGRNYKVVQLQHKVDSTCTSCLDCVG